MASNAAKYRGATVEDLEPPSALSVSPQDSISHALLTAYERDYTHLTVVSAERALLGYISIPRLKQLLEARRVRDADPVEQAMQRFKRRGRKYRVITLDTELAELEKFFTESETDFAVITDAERKFVLGVATRGDLEEFVRRRPA